jgi:hypothetical protein
VLHITYLSDRLPAIGGVAALFRRRMKGRYLAGHWEDDLVRSLCWEVQYDPSQPDLLAAPEDYLAPTWSWVSVVVHIGYHPTPNFRPRAETVRVFCSQLGLNPFGRVSSRSSELRGRLVECELANDEGHENMSAYRVSPTHGHGCSQR